MVLPGTEMGNKMTDGGMSVGLLCSAIGHTMGFKWGKWLENVWKETTEEKERHWNEIKGTKIGRAFAENQRISECFVVASPQALTSQLWSIHWTLHWSSDPQVKEGWMRKEQVNDKCNWSETQVTLECPRRNASARRVSRKCPPRAGCRPMSHFSWVFFYSVQNYAGSWLEFRFMVHTWTAGHLDQFVLLVCPNVRLCVCFIFQM